MMVTKIKNCKLDLTMPYGECNLIFFLSKGSNIDDFCKAKYGSDQHNEMNIIIGTLGHGEKYMKG